MFGQGGIYCCDTKYDLYFVCLNFHDSEQLEVSPHNATSSQQAVIAEIMKFKNHTTADQKI